MNNPLTQNTILAVAYTRMDIEDDLKSEFGIIGCVACREICGNRRLVIFDHLIENRLQKLPTVVADGQGALLCVAGKVLTQEFRRFSVHLHKEALGGYI